MHGKEKNTKTTINNYNKKKIYIHTNKNVFS